MEISLFLDLKSDFWGDFGPSKMAKLEKTLNLPYYNNESKMRFWRFRPPTQENPGFGAIFDPQKALNLTTKWVFIDDFWDFWVLGVFLTVF